MLGRPRTRSRNCPTRRSANQQDATIWRAIAQCPAGPLAGGACGFQGRRGRHGHAADRVAAHGDAGVDEGHPSKIARLRRRHAGLVQRVRDHGRAARTWRAPIGRSDRPSLSGPGPNRGRDQRAIAPPPASRGPARRGRKGGLREIVLLFASGRHAAQGRDPTTSKRSPRFGAADENREPKVSRCWRISNTEDSRYREAFHVMRTALVAHPNSESDPPDSRTRRRRPSTGLFLAGKGDALPADSRRSACSTISRTDADRAARRRNDPPGSPTGLVAVDLLDQAAELLQHQVDHRLQGAGRGASPRDAAGHHLSDEPQAGSRASPPCRRRARPILSGEMRDQRLPARGARHVRHRPPRSRRSK